MNPSKLTYEEIVSNPASYEEIAALKHKEIKEFVVKELETSKGWGRIINMYQLAGMLLFLLGTFKAFMPFYARREFIYLLYLGAGVLFTVTVLIVLHELIHALAYKYVGAKHVSFGMNLRKFIFYVQSDKDVFNYAQFKIVALAPALVIGILSLLGMIVFYNQALMYFFVSIFAFHSFFCGGDFGMLCFFQNRPDKEIYTFDLKAEGESYFYAKR